MRRKILIVEKKYIFKDNSILNLEILDNQIIGLYFFAENIRINITAKVYFAFLEEILLNLLHDVPLAILPNIIFQQDGHLAHTFLLARTILNQRFPKRWIGIRSTLHEQPPRSPDITPIFLYETTFGIKFTRHYHAI